MILICAAMAVVAHKRMKGIHDVIKNPFKFPFAEIVMDRLPRTELSRAKLPLAACLVDEKDDVHNVTTRMFSGAFLCVDFFR